jgi:hypothetical protein
MHGAPGVHRIVADALPRIGSTVTIHQVFSLPKAGIHQIAILLMLA